MSIRFSVIIPTYNRAQLLGRCLRSVLGSHLEDIEVLVADNASTDATQEVLKSFQDPRLRFWRNETNVGAERNILNLLRAAQGEWVVCLGDDDFLLPNALERLVPIVQFDPSLGVVMYTLKVVDPNGNYLWTYRAYKQTTKFSAGMEALSQMVWAAHGFSRITVHRKWLDISGAERHLHSMYPQMYLVGVVLKEHPGFYLDECLVAVTTGNQTSWEYPKDFMVGDRIKMMKDMLPGPRWKAERRVLIQQTIKDVSGFSYAMSLAWSKSIPDWMATQIALLHIPEVAFSRQYWWGLPRFLGMKAIYKLMKGVAALRDRKLGLARHNKNHE
jgi:glycosyltransferase involved in cell wall biosynthesis